MEMLLDGALVMNRADLHAQLAEGLHLPDWYGNNLDALYDCLTDLHQETVLRLVNQGSLEAQLGPYAQKLVQVIRRAAEENPHFQVVEGKNPGEKGGT